MELIPNLKDNGLDEEALDMIAAEDIAQIEQWGYKEHLIDTWYLILMKQVGQLAVAILELKIAKVEKEATQVATVALKIARMVRDLSKQN